MTLQSGAVAGAAPTALDSPDEPLDNGLMSTGAITDLVHELQVTLARAAKGVRDSEEMRQARNEMNRMREELRQKIGTVEIAVDLVRDARNQ
ncbi:MAG TPA: hypothetical protein VND64_02040 [Pirellulales bacterium]|nr:hypothetical protein [Pirellulales bacterium]